MRGQKSQSNHNMSEELYDHEHEEEVVPFAAANFRGDAVKFGIKTDDRRRHVYVVGKTGMGKTTLLENMVLHDIYAGHGVAYIDPHGDTADNLLDFIPPHRVKDVVYFNPSDLDYPIGFNILEVRDEAQKHLVASGLMGVFKKIWEGVWSPRMEYILLNCILAMLEVPNSTMMGIARILADKDYREEIVAQIKDPVVKSFWVNEFAGYSDRFASEAVAPVQNKVGQFLSAGIVRNIVAQQKSTIDLRSIMDENKILICNLSKGLIGEDNSKLLGGMIITRLQLSAMQRVDMLEHMRPDFYLYVDEFQNFATESFANILSEARKYRLNLITAHQYIEQLDETVAAAIFGNVGTIISFRVGSQDAETLAKEFAPTFTEEDVINLAKFEIYLKLMIDGVASTPFSARTLPPIAKRAGSREEVIAASRKRYAMKREDVEDIVEKWSEEAGAAMRKGKSGGKGGAKFGNRSAGQEDDRQHVANCSRCKKELRLKFAPDPSRPFYCKECLPEVKKERDAGVRPPKTDFPPRSDAPPPIPPSASAVNATPKVEERPAPKPRPAPEPKSTPELSRPPANDKSRTPSVAKAPLATKAPAPPKVAPAPSRSPENEKKVAPPVSKSEISHTPKPHTPASPALPKMEKPKSLSSLPSLSTPKPPQRKDDRPARFKKPHVKNRRPPPPPLGGGSGGRIRIVSSDTPSDDEILTLPKKNEEKVREDTSKAESREPKAPVVAFKDPETKKSEHVAPKPKPETREHKPKSKDDTEKRGPKPLQPGESVSF